MNTNMNIVFCTTLIISNIYIANDGLYNLLVGCVWLIVAMIILIREALRR